MPVLLSWAGRVMPSWLVLVFAVPLAIAAAFSFAFRRGPGAHLLIWLASFPLLWAASVFLTLVISFQVLGVDLVD